MPQQGHEKPRYRASVRGRARRRSASQERGRKVGSVLILALGVLVLVSMLAIFFYTVTRAEREIAADEVNRTRAEMLAQSGLEIAKANLRRAPRNVSWPNPIELKTYFMLPPDELGESIELDLPLGHPDTPFFINWDMIITPGFGDRSTDRFSTKPSSLLPMFMRDSFSDGEPFRDSGFHMPGDAPGVLTGAGDRIFSFYDENANGVHDMGELCEPFDREHDLNNNGVHDSYAGAVTFSIDDSRGTYSLSIQDNGGLIYINGGTLMGKDWLPDWARREYSPARIRELKKWMTRKHSRHVVKILDNLGVILGLMTEEMTYEQDELGNPTPKATGKGLGHLLIYGYDGGDEDWYIDGRPEGGYSSKREVRRVLSQIQQQVEPSLTDEKINLFLSMITTVAWVDKTTVVGARFLYPEEYESLLGESRNDYIVLEPTPSRDNATGFDLKGCNPAGILVPGRAEEDAEPRYGDDFEDIPPRPIEIDDPDNIEGFDKDDDLDNIMGWLYEPRAPININSAPQPVIEAVLTYLEATYVTDRENNLYPNRNVIGDWRTGPMVFVGTPAYNFVHADIKEWDGKEAGAPLPWSKLYNWYSSYSGPDREEISTLIERVNPTIGGTPPVIILPEEARAIAAAIVEYRRGGDKIAQDGDRNGNGILDFGDDVERDGEFGLLEAGIEWEDVNGDEFYQGGPFHNMEEFFVFLNMQKFRLFGRCAMCAGADDPFQTTKHYGIPFRRSVEQEGDTVDMRIDSRATNLFDLKVDLIFANANPNADVMRFNPNASWASLNRVDSKGYYLRRNVTRFDLFDVEGRPTHTTEFCTQPTGIFQMESIGRVLGADGSILAECGIRSAVRIFDSVRLTSQKDFEMGPNPLAYDPDDPSTHDDYFFNTNIAQKKAEGENVSTTMTLPEAEWRATGLDGNPRKDDWQANVAGYDGQITLATTFETDRAMLESFGQGPTLRAYARFSAGEGGEDDTLGGRYTDPGQDSHLQDELNLRLLTSDRLGWIRPTGALRMDMIDDPTDNWDYDITNHRIHTSPDLDHDGRLNYEGENAYGDDPEDTSRVIVRPLLEPEQYPPVGLRFFTHKYYGISSTAHGKDENELRIIACEPQAIYPFYDKTFARFNNYHVYPMTVPRFDHEANLLPDGFLKCGVRRICYNMLPKRERSPEEEILVQDFTQSLVDEWSIESQDNCLTFLVEMWVKPMFSATKNDNSVRDGNWEDMMKRRGNWRFPVWEGPDGNDVHGELQHSPRSYDRLLQISFMLQYVLFGVTDLRDDLKKPPPSGPGPHIWRRGSKLKVNTLLPPLNWWGEVPGLERYYWTLRRPFMFQFEDTLYPKDFTMSREYPDSIDPEPEAPREPMIRDGEWFHFAFICNAWQSGWFLNGKLIESKTLEGSPLSFANLAIENIELPDFACTVDEIKIYTNVGAASTAREYLREHLDDGRYFDEGTYISPVFHLPKGTSLEGVNWTQFIPRTLDGDETEVTVYILDEDGRPLRDEQGYEIELSDPDNSYAIGSLADTFRLKVEMKALPRDQLDEIGVLCLMDTPVVDDITIIIACREEVLLWELME